MLLHIINKSPFTHSVMQDALPFINKNDTVIFIDDGVYIFTHPDLFDALVAKKCRITALANDMRTRGVIFNHTTIEAIDMSIFVELVFSSSKTISWH